MGLFGVVPPANDGSLMGGFGRFEPKRTYNFNVQFLAGATAGADAGIVSLLGDGTTAAAKGLAYSVYKVARPNITFQNIDIQHGNEKFKIAGRSDWANDNFTTEHYDLIPNSVTDAAGNDPVDNNSGTGVLSAGSVLYNWQNLMQNILTGDASFAKNYKGRMLLTLFTPDGSKTVEKWLYEGIWPQAVQESEMDYTATDGAATITCTWYVDKIFKISVNKDGSDSTVADATNSGNLSTNAAVIDGQSG